MAAPVRIDELAAGGSLSAGAAVAVVQGNDTIQKSARSFITEAESFTQSETGASARSVQGKLRDVVSVKDFGAVCDDSTDDTAAIQAAIDHVGSTSVNVRAGIDILIPGPCRITGTLTIQKKGSMRLVGNGWGHRDDTGTRRSYLRWDGAAGDPMIKIIDCWGAGVARLKLMGNTSAKPSAAIEINNSNTGWPNYRNKFEDLYIGSFSSETDDGDQFTDGILWSGTNNNSEHSFQNIHITGCTGNAIKQNSIQNVNIRIDHASMANSGVGLYVTGNIQGSNWNFSNCDVDIFVPNLDAASASVNPHIMCDGYYSELAGRMAEIVGSARLVLSGTQFQASASLNADGKVIKADGTQTAVTVIIRDMRFTASSPAAAPYLALAPGAAGQRHIVIEDVVDWETVMTGGTNGMDVLMGGVNARVYVFFRSNPASTGLGYGTRVAQNFLCGTVQQWDMGRFDLPNEQSVRMFDDFMGDVLADQWGSAAGTDPQVVSPAILTGSGVSNGVVRMTTGDDAAADMATNGVQLQAALNYSANQGPVVFETRVRMSAITNVVVYVGFTGQVASLQMPFTYSGTTLTSNATDAVGWLFDTSADVDNWKMVGVANNVDATVQDAGTAPVAATYERLRVELAGSVATFYRNGVKVGTTMSGAISGAILTPVIAAFSRDAASRNIDSDYVSVQSGRSWP